MNRSCFRRLRTLLRNCVFDIRWKLGMFKKSKPTGCGHLTHLPDGELYYISPRNKAASTVRTPLGEIGVR